MIQIPYQNSHFDFVSVRHDFIDILSYSSLYQYESSDPAIIPGKSYKWRVRVKSTVENYYLPWSEENQFTIDSLYSPQPSGLVYTVKPIFNIEGPSDVAY